MADAFTARNWPIDNAPPRIELLGDKMKRPEPAQHIIEFPGGAIEVSRTTDGLYWAHIIVEDQRWARTEGRVVGTRLFIEGQGLTEIADEASWPGVRQIAVLIKPLIKPVRK
ncbi:hypothetical protein [Methylosinus sp. Sm6]|uniref:hypothetical protein n=1 Tax=Methylosinus sp. Sm6 TaxID=2866948 RepID=UPI001C9A0B10|nr:hypothetical protein [Methylosinus sp. Sm6]MBY6243878.1 hypothetical protein [Methylosinus sp. Sm6]